MSCPQWWRGCSFHRATWWSRRRLKLDLAAKEIRRRKTACIVQPEAVCRSPSTSRYGWSWVPAYRACARCEAARQGGTRPPVSPVPPVDSRRVGRSRLPASAMDSWVGQCLHVARSLRWLRWIADHLQRITTWVTVGGQHGVQLQSGITPRDDIWPIQLSKYPKRMKVFNILAGVQFINI